MHSQRVPGPGGKLGVEIVRRVGEGGEHDDLAVRFAIVGVDGLGWVLEAKGYSGVSGQSAWIHYSSFWNVPGSNGIWVVPAPRFYFGEGDLACKSGGEGVDVWEWVAVWDGDVGQPLVVSSGSFARVSLVDDV